MELDALHTGRLVGADREQRDRQGTGLLRRRGGPWAEGVRDHFARAVEDPQVRQISVHHTFVDRARQRELLERVLTAGLQRDAVREVARLLGGRQGGHQEQRGDQRSHRASRGDRGGTGEK